MADPFRRLKLLPWRSLLQAALLTVVICVAVDYLIILGAGFSAIRQMLAILFKPPLGLLLVIAVAVGIGALAVYVLERFFKQVLINAVSLWALIFCLWLVLFVKTLLPLPALLVGMSEFQLVGIILGVFWKGRPYWRWR